MHVAYNLIRPDKFTMNEPYFDQIRRDAVCRALEKEFCLAVDNGIEISDPLEPKINQRAAALEVHSGEQSFQSFALARRQQILDEMKEAQSWSDAHRIFATHGIVIKPQANGLVFANADGKNKETMKASAFDRSMSKAKLIARFGDYVQADELKEKEAKTDDPNKAQYDKKPLQPRSPERDELYKTYRAVLAEKIARIDAEKARGQAAFDGLKACWQQAKLNAGNRRMYGMMLAIQRRDMAKAKIEHQERLAAIKKDYLWHNWNGFLQSRAESGDKTALAVLRSQEERRAGKTRANKNPEPEKIFLTVPFTDKAAAKNAGAKWDGAEKKWYAPAGTDLSQFAAWLPAGNGKGSDKESVQFVAEKSSPVTRLSRLVWQEKERLKAGVAGKSHFAGFQLHIDNRGVVIISLASGGTIRDAGNKLHFSPNNETRQAARLYAMAKFGQDFSEKDNSIKRHEHG